MSNPILNKADIGYFFENRKKFDQMITEIMGDDIHLHDISQDSDRSQDRIDQSFGKPSNSSSFRNLNKSKYDDFYSNVENSNKIEKLYKENIDLQKKNMTLKQENQAKKYKAEMWDQTKQFIIDSVHPYIELKSVRFKSSDTALISQFFVTIEEIISNQLSDQAKSKNQWEDQQTIQSLKKKIENQIKQNSKVSVERDRLLEQNNHLLSKISVFSESRKVRYSQIQQNLEQKFAVLQNDLEDKKRQNQSLRDQIRQLDEQLQAEKNQKEKNSAFNEKDRSEFQMLKKISKMREEEITVLQQENRSLQGKLSIMKKSHDKMKKALLYAKQINDQFMKKIEEAASKHTMIKKSSDFNLNSEYFNDSKMQKNVQLLPQTRFKIVKSKSLSKDAVSRRSRYI